MGRSLLQQSNFRLLWLGRSLSLYAWNHAAIRISLLLVAMLNLATLGSLVVGVAKLVELRFDGSATTYGYLQAAFGAGAFVGVLATSQIRSVTNPGRSLVLAYGLGVGTAGLGFVQQQWMAYGLIILMGLGGGFVGVIAVSWLQEQTSAAMRADDGLVDIYLSGA